MSCKLYVRVPRPPLPVNLQVHRICAYVGALLYLLPVLQILKKTLKWYIHDNHKTILNIWNTVVSVAYPITF